MTCYTLHKKKGTSCATTSQFELLEFLNEKTFYLCNWENNNV